MRPEVWILCAERQRGVRRPFAFGLPVPLRDWPPQFRFFRLHLGDLRQQPATHNVEWFASTRIILGDPRQQPPDHSLGFRRLACKGLFRDDRFYYSSARLTISHGIVGC